MKSLRSFDKPDIMKVKTIRTVQSVFCFATSPYSPYEVPLFLGKPIQPDFNDTLQCFNKELFRANCIVYFCYLEAE